MDHRPMNNLDLVCQLESRSVAPFCGQRINPRYIPSELMQKGIQMPLQVVRHVCNSYIRDIGFGCFNCTTAWFFWFFVYISFSSVFWTGYTFLWFSDPYYNSRYLGLGLGLSLTFVCLLVLHVFCCVACKLWRRRPIDDKLSLMNSAIAPYNCLGTVTTSRYGFSYYLSLYYYDINPCVLELATTLQRRGNIAATGYGMVQVEMDPNADPNNVFQDQARALILTHSPTYLRQFREEDLPEVITQRHARQTECLCQYVQTKLASYRGTRLNDSRIM